jgi:hypothetical protein
MGVTALGAKMNSPKEQPLDGTLLPVPRPDAHSPEAGRVKSESSSKGKASRVAVDLPGDPLSPEMIAEFRERLARGTYDLPAVRHALAVRLIESGDL